MIRVSNISLFSMLLLLGIVVAISSLMIGRYPVTLADLWQFVRSWVGPADPGVEQIKTVLVDIRLPRVLAAFLVGGTLAITGATYQGMFRNPMVSPSILGVSTGAGFGAALSIMMGMSLVLQHGLSFLFGVVAVVLVYIIGLATGKRYDKSLTLILAGIVVSTLFSALISIIKYIADPDEALPSIVYWLMGGLSDVQGHHLWMIGGISLNGLLLLIFSGWKLDMLSFGEDEAKAMGVRVERFRLLIIGVATLMTSAAVSISGVIGWVGLLIPHITRMITGPRNAVLLPASFLMGGIFLLVVDDFSRTVSSMEIPLGITTSLLGAPFFIYILMKTSKKQ